MLTIQRAVHGDGTVFKLSGRMNAENLADVKALFALEANGQGMILDLKDLTLVDREAVRFLERLESDSARLTNCPLYIRELILRERGANGLRKRRANRPEIS